MKTSELLSQLIKQVGKDTEAWTTQVETEIKDLSEQTGKELRAFTKEALSDLGGGLRRIADALETAAKEGAEKPSEPEVKP